MDRTGRDRLLFEYNRAATEYAEAVERLKSRQGTSPQNEYQALLQSVRIAKRKCDLLHLALERELNV